jgi:hypothetical protein
LAVFLRLSCDCRDAVRRDLPAIGRYLLRRKIFL